LSPYLITIPFHLNVAFLNLTLSLVTTGIPTPAFNPPRGGDSKPHERSTVAGLYNPFLAPAASSSNTSGKFTTNGKKNLLAMTFFNFEYLRTKFILKKVVHFSDDLLGSIHLVEIEICSSRTCCSFSILSPVMRPDPRNRTVSSAASNKFKLCFQNQKNANR